MYELANVVETVTNWTTLGVKLPKDLAEAIELYNAISFVVLDYHPSINIDTLTTDNLEAKIRGLADEMLLTQITNDAGPRMSALGRARAQTIAKLGHKVSVLANLAVPTIIEQLTPAFTEAAAAYTAAVSLLPPKFDSDTLVSAKPAVVQAYQDAQAAAACLDLVSSWVASVASTCTPDLSPEPTLRVLRPTSMAQAIKLDEASRVQANNPAVAAINPVYVAAVRNRVRFAINTPRESEDLRQHLFAEAEADSLD